MLEMINRRRIISRIIYLALMTLTVLSMVACGKQGASQNAAAPAAQESTASSNSALITREQPQNAAPLGIEVGYANLRGVKANIEAVTTLQEKGINQYSGGPMLASNGDGVGVEGLSQLLLIFDKNNMLSGVIMTLPKNPRDIFAKLSTKYKPVENRIDNFMNKGYARLEKGESWVEIDAPHMSFTMEVRYLTKQLLADFKSKSSEDEARKNQEQTNKL